MCGRYTQTSKPEQIRALIDFEGDEHLLDARYNIAPTQPAPVITAGHHLQAMPWGLVPVWAKPDAAAHRLINLRSETVLQKPAFQPLIQRQRCLVPADGFYEWQKSGRRRQPYLFRLRSAAPFAFAGVWDRWRAPDGQELRGFAILTTDANELVRPIHNRMPVLLGPEACARWLEAPDARAESLGPLLQSYPAEAMTTSAVNPIVNSAQVDSPECIAPVEPVEPSAPPASGPVNLELDFGN